jgi:hypothetical protein
MIHINCTGLYKKHITCLFCPMKQKHECKLRQLNAYYKQEKCSFNRQRGRKEDRQTERIIRQNPKLRHQEYLEAETL